MKNSFPFLFFAGVLEITSGFFEQLFLLEQRYLLYNSSQE
jgi:hypothetical protein